MPEPPPMTSCERTAAPTLCSQDTAFPVCPHHWLQTLSLRTSRESVEMAPTCNGAGSCMALTRSRIAPSAKASKSVKLSSSTGGARRNPNVLG